MGSLNCMAGILKCWLVDYERMILRFYLKILYAICYSGLERESLLRSLNGRRGYLFGTPLPEQNP